MNTQTAIVVGVGLLAAAFVAYKVMGNQQALAAQQAGSALPAAQFLPQQPAVSAGDKLSSAVQAGSVLVNAVGGLVSDARKLFKF